MLFMCVWFNPSCLFHLHLEMISNNNVFFSRRLFAKDMSRFARLCRIVPTGTAKSHCASKRMVVAVNSLCRVPGAGPGLQNGGGCWVDNKPFSLTTQCQYSYLLFLLCFTGTLLSFFLPAFSDIDKMCKLSVSARSVYSSCFHSLWLAFWNIFKQYLKNLLHNIFPWPQEDCYWETYMHVFNTHTKCMNLWLWPFDHIWPMLKV